jgi:hypothetical protein
LAEVVVTAAPRLSRYRVEVGNFVVEVDDDFQTDTLRRLVAAISAC